jgi:NADH-ubiquinone oxidoreductase chain 5
MYLALITLPLLGSIVSGFFGRKVGVSGAQLITCTSVITTTILAIVAFFEVGLNNVPVSISLFRWIDSESLNVLWGFNFDSLTVSMLIPVLIISSLVHIYSIGYMSHDPHNQRFFSYLSLFTFMMIILVTANNFLLMFVGWEGVGICSYLLVSFWFTRIAANQSSMSAFLTNRVGDCFLTIGMFAILWTFGNIDYSTVFSLAPFVNENLVTIIGICLLIGAMAKSSQVGLHVWLPMAMEGPTPVSALIHAATMVTAGVYLLMRTSPLIEYSSTVLILCLWLGAITTVFSSLIGLFQQDIKKVIAYSTMSQLGMMVIAVGLSSYNIALFHLVNHAFYKGLLFLGAGAVIHAVADNQDFRKYGGLRPFLPLTYSVMLIASLSLVAFPFMTGFYSKDFILESAYGQFYFSGTVVYFIATIGAMFTTLYSVKVLYLTFLTNPNGPVVNYKHAHEGDIFMSLPLIILALFSIFFGYITKDIFIGLGSGFFSDNSLFIHPTHEIMLDTEFAVPTLFKLLPLFFTVSLSVLAIILSEFLGNILIAFKFTRLGYNIFGFFNQRFLIELFYNKYITGLVLKLGGQTTKVIDKGSVELLGPFGLEKGLINLSRNIASLDTGVITSYALYILIGLIFYILIPYLTMIDNSLLLLTLLSLFSVINTNTHNNTTDNSKVVLESNILSNFFNVLLSIFTIKNIVLFIVFISTFILGKVFLCGGFTPFTYDNITEAIIGPISIKNGLILGLYSILFNWIRNIYKLSARGIVRGLLIVLSIASLKQLMSGGFSPMTFNNFWDTFNNPLSIPEWLGLVALFNILPVLSDGFNTIIQGIKVQNITWNGKYYVFNNTNMPTWYSRSFSFRDLFGLDTIKMNDGPLVEDFKPKLYNPMNSSQPSGSSSNTGQPSGSNTGQASSSASANRPIQDIVYVSDPGSPTCRTTTLHVEHRRLLDAKSARGSLSPSEEIRFQAIQDEIKRLAIRMGEMAKEAKRLEANLDYSSEASDVRLQQLLIHLDNHDRAIREAVEISDPGSSAIRPVRSIYR